MSLFDILTIEGFRDDDWFNENIWDDDLDKNEIVELVLKEISKDVKEFIKETLNDFEERLSPEVIYKKLKIRSGEKLI